MLADLRNALPYIAGAMANKFGVRVLQGDKACTNCKDIFLPPLPGNDRKTMVKALGFIGHESAHISDTDPSVLKEKLPPAVFSLMNTLEDMRIDRRQMNRYPGFADTRGEMMQNLVDDNQLFVPDENSHPFEIMERFVHYTLRHDFLKQVQLAPVKEKTEEVFRKKFPRGAAIRLEALMFEIEHAKSTRDVLDLTMNIMKMVQEESDKEDEKNQQSSQDGDQSQEQGDSHDQEQGDSQAQGQGDGQSQDDGQGQQQDSDQSKGQGDSQDQGQGSSQTQDQSDSQDQGQDDSQAQGQGDDQAQDDAQSQQQGDGQNQDQGDSSGQGDDDSQSQSDSQSQAPGTSQGQDDGQDAGQSQGQDDSGTQGPAAAADGDDHAGNAEFLRKVVSAGNADVPEEFGQMLARQLNAVATPYGMSVFNASKQPSMGSEADYDMQACANINALSHRLHMLMQAQTRCRKFRLEYGNRLSVNHLYEARLGGKIFERKIRGQKIDTAVGILVDRSGSTKNIIAGLGQIAYATSAALAAVNGISVAVGAFPFSDGVQYLSFFGDRPKGRTMNFAGLTHGGYTPMTESLYRVGIDLLMQPQQRKLLMVVTDGDPDDMDSALKAIQETERAGVEVLGIGIKVNLSALFGRWVSIDSLDELPNRMFELLGDSLLAQAA